MSYPLITALENSDATYRELISQYSSLYSQYIDDKSTNSTTGIREKEQMLSQIVDSMKQELDKMNNLLNDAYNNGLTNQKLSAEASNALAQQSTLIEMRMKQYQDARNSLARVIGEETSSGLNVTRNRYIYYIYFIFALALCASIIHLIMGGSLPFGILIMLFILGIFVSWEFYKSWLGRVGDSINIGSMNVKGVFRVVT